MEVGAASQVAATAFKLASPATNVETAGESENGEATSGAGVQQAEAGEGKGLVVDIKA